VFREHGAGQRSDVLSSVERVGEDFSDTQLAEIFLHHRVLIDRPDRLRAHVSSPPATPEDAASDSTASDASAIARLFARGSWPRDRQDRGDPAQGDPRRPTAAARRRRGADLGELAMV